MVINDSPVFIVGVPRSGTTLLRLILNSHSEIAICGEIHFFDQIREIEKKIPKVNKNNLNQFLGYLNNTYALQRIAKKEELIKNAIAKFYTDENFSFEKFYYYLMKEYAKFDNKRIIGEKTPQNIRYIEEIKSIFPTAKIIHIRRDPRAVVASMLKVDWTSDDILINTLKWKIDLIYSEVLKNAGLEYKEIDYEDLVSKSKETVVEICKFLDIDFEQDMLNYYKTSKHYIGENQPEKANTFKPITETQLKNWTKELSETQIYLIEKISGSYFKKLGYKKHKISIISKLVSPYVLLKEMYKYYKYKKMDSKHRAETTPYTIYGDNSKLQKMFLKALFTRYFVGQK